VNYGHVLPCRVQVILNGMLRRLRLAITILTSSSSRVGVCAALAVSWIALPLTNAGSVPPQSAVVHGHIVYRGGPAPGINDASQAGVLAVFSSDGAVVARYKMRVGARMSLHLRPGAYFLGGSSGDAVCHRRAFSLRSHQHLTVSLICSIR
jgi:hypothetical protein